MEENKTPIAATHSSATTTICPDIVALAATATTTGRK